MLTNTQLKSWLTNEIATSIRAAARARESGHTDRYWMGRRDALHNVLNLLAQHDTGAPEEEEGKMETNGDTRIINGISETYIDDDRLLGSTSPGWFPTSQVDDLRETFRQEGERSHYGDQ